MSVQPVTISNDTSPRQGESKDPYEGPEGEGIKLPPRNLEAEQALLGALLHSNRAYETISEYLKPEHFFDPINGRIYEAIGRLIERGQVADPITLRDFFTHDESLLEVGGTEYLAHLATSVVTILNTVEYAKLIHDLSIRRDLIDLGTEVVNKAFEPSLVLAAQEQIESAEQHLYDLATVGQTDRGFVSFGSALTETIKMANAAYKRDSKLVGVTTGLRDLDHKLGGLHPSDLVVLAGRPSMGKTALATNIAFNAALAELEKKEDGEGAVVAFFSLEMSSEQLAGRLLSQESHVPSDEIRRGEIKEEYFVRFADMSRRMASLPLYIDDTPALTISALRTRARRLKRKHGLGLIVVDYLQLLSGNKASDNRVQEVSEITRGLKTLAKELHVPVVALSQLSRSVEQRDDKRPLLSDLRESGSIEQDADVVMFVYREGYYLARQEPSEGDSEKYLAWQQKMLQTQNTSELIISKQRHGPIGTVKLFCDGRFTKFADFEEEGRYPQATIGS